MTSSVLPPELASSVEYLYDAFSTYGLRLPMDKCGHCGLEDAEQALATHSLRELPADDASYYGFKAMSTWGDANDYRHFLPRLLELAVFPDGASYPGLALDLIFRKLTYAGWRDWPRREQQAVVGFVDAAWSCSLGNSISAEPLDLLIAISQFDEPEPYLRRWEQRADLAARAQLARTIRCHWTSLQEDRLGSDWGSPAHERTVIGWLTAPQRERELLTAFDQHPTGEDGTLLAEAVDAFGWIRVPAGRVVESRTAKE